MPRLFTRTQPVVWLGVAIAALTILQMPLQSAEACALTVQVDGLRNGNGLLGGVVFKTPGGWPEDHDRAFTRTAAPVAGNSQLVLTFPEIPSGRYGIAVLHDENSNHRLDRNIFRLPKEGFGFANNPHVGLTAPSWQESSVQVTCPSTDITIQLIYK